MTFLKGFFSGLFITILFVIFSNNLTPSQEIAVNDPEECEAELSELSAKFEEAGILVETLLTQVDNAENSINSVADDLEWVIDGEYDEMNDTIKNATDNLQTLDIVY